MPSVYILLRQRNHWAKLHKGPMTEEQFNQWLDLIPGYEDLSCNCQKKVYNILEKLPPRYDDFNRFGWELHNAVNISIGKPEISWEEACLLWGWETTKGTK